MTKKVAPPKRKVRAGGRARIVVEPGPLEPDTEKKIKKAIAKTAKEEAKLKTKLSSAKVYRKKKEGLLKTAKNIEEGKSSIISGELAEHIKDREVIFQPNKGPQTSFLAAAEDEVFYGGARGGGKSFAMIIDPLRHCQFRIHRAVILRRTMPELRELIRHTQYLYPKAYPGARWRDQDKEWIFPSGAKVEFGYAETENDLLRYQGQSYTYIGIDELPQFPDPRMWYDLKASLRSVDPRVPARMRATGNPGNIGSMWVKKMFIDPAPPGQAFPISVETPAGTRIVTRRFIPAKVTDNPHLMQTDAYLTALSSLPEIRRKQFLEGDWDAFDNAAFPEFTRGVHTVRPFKIPSNWPRFRACDWGYSSPACCLWFAVDGEGNLIVYRELYTKGKTADTFAKMVLECESEDPPIHFGIMDSSLWAKRGDVGPSIIEVMRKEGCYWRPSDRSRGSRVAGKAEVHRRLQLEDDSFGEKKPRVTFFNTCIDTIRTIPMLQCDKNNPEDVDTHMEDHAYDAFRYGCMSRPISHVALAARIAADFQHKEANYRPADPTFGY